MQARPARFLEELGTPVGDGDSVASWIADLAQRPEHRGAIAHWETLPARPARYGELSLPLPGPLAK